ncbi:MAG: carboxypeptidase-like regulatory domain-containing protein [Candidatus Acidiferrales bacterium]
MQGTVTDRSGAIIPGAAVTIANRDTGQSLAVTTNAAGAYNSGALIPGNYDVRVEVKGFKTVNESVTPTTAATWPTSTRMRQYKQSGQRTAPLGVQALTRRRSIAL